MDRMKQFEKDFDVKKETQNVIEWIRDFFHKNGEGCNAVVAISGGKDSSVVAALCVRALGKDRVHGVLLPNGKQDDIDASKLLVKHLDITHSIINIKEAVDSLLDGVKAELSTEIKIQTITNLPARIRMAATYAVAQSMNGRVANTSNFSEDWVGYATRYGDAAGDFSPLAKFTVGEVKMIGTYLGLPHELVYKVPIDGLTPYTDEENLGFSYAVLDEYIRTGFCHEPEIKENIDKRHKANLFKLSMMPVYEYKGPVKAEEGGWKERSDMPKTMIIYYSRRGENYANGEIVNLKKGNTEFVVDYLKEATGADVFHVDTVKEYCMEYTDCIKESKEEITNDERPELKEYLESLDGYDDVILAAPNWHGTYPMPMFTQLEKLDFTGKKVYPIITHEGSGLADTLEWLARTCKGAEIEEGLAIHGTKAPESKDILTEWVEKCMAK